MFLFKRKVESHPTYSGLAYLLINDDGIIILANEAFISIVKNITGITKKLKSGDIVGKKLTEVFGNKYYRTVVGSFMKDKKIFNKTFLISNHTYQVTVRKIMENENTYYEFYYISTQSQHGLLRNSLKKISSRK